MASEVSQNLSLKILVEKEKNKVVFAEASRDFVDVIFSFMTMPIGTIVRLTCEHFLKGDNSLNNLYESIENLDEEHLSSKLKVLLLHPRSAAEIYCRNLKLNLTGSNNSKYYVCSSESCIFLSYYKTACCRCGRPLEFEVELSNPVPQDGDVFVKPTARFMITDDFQVLPLSTMTGLSLLSNLGATDGSKIEERTVNIGKDEVLKLLKCSLASRTPFSDTILGSPIKPVSKASSMFRRGQYGPRTADQSRRVMDATNEHQKIKLKLIINSSNKKALYAEVEENFVDLLCSFLSVPIGHVFKEFSGLSFKGCMGNLYKSIQDSNVKKVFKSKKMKAILVNPKLAPGLAYNSKVTGIEEDVTASYSTLSSLFTTSLKDLLDKAPDIGSDGFIKGPSMFMVTDNLSITPLSPISGISLINRLKVPLSNVAEFQVTMGEEETSHLLVAALVSRFPLTDAFMRKEPKQEPLSE